MIPSLHAAMEHAGQEQPQYLRRNPSVMKDDIRRVDYNNEKHLATLIQMYGSVWPKVFPYCVANIFIMWFIIVLDKFYDINVTITSTGMELTAVLAAFLIVSRTHTVFTRFTQTANHLFNMNQNCREFILNAYSQSKHDNSEKAKEWRFELSFRLILLLRTTMAALEYRSSEVNTWDVLPDDWSELLTSSQGLLHVSKCEVSTRWAHGKRTINDENLRSPIVLSHYLGEQVVKQREGLLHPKLHPLEELKLLGNLTNFMTEYHHLRASIASPFPFPLVQMARTFLFFWVFTLPFALAKDVSDPWQVAVMLFIATYGYIGLEFVSIELDDPFGDDPNDFDDLAYAQMVFEDVYIALSKVDGSETSEKLREKVELVAARFVPKKRQTPPTTRNVAGRVSATETTPLTGRYKRDENA